MTNHWNDIANADVVLMMGCNPAENHPISFKYVLKAQDKGATLIHVDPRYTRTSAKCDIWASMRSGADLAIFGAMINYILQNKLYFQEYVAEYTNAGLLVDPGFAFKDGYFAGWNAEKTAYDKATWKFQLDENGVPKRDKTLSDPRCVINLMKEHYSRYSLEKASDVSGMPVADMKKVFDAYCATGKADKAGTMLYAMGQTQHTVGVQNIRAMAMIQLLLGNVGIAGGGINALRGEANVQGSTDHGLLVHILPGYMATPQADWETLATYNEKNTPASKDPMSVNWWQNKPKYFASLLKAMYPDAELEQAYQWLPKRDPGVNYTWLKMFDEMHQGKIKGFFAWGQNPACGGANSNKTREALAKLDWLVAVNLVDCETSHFWEGPGMDPKKIKTECFLLPCCMSVEKQGSVINSGRWLQWRYAGPAPMGHTKPDGDIIYELYGKIRQLYEKDTKAKAREQILALNWDHANDHHEFDPHKVAKLINGKFLKDKTLKVGDKDVEFKAGQQVPSFALLQADGSTSSGCWVYSGSYTDKGNMAARRDKTQTEMQANIGLFPNWAWAWPLNRRIIYNRASVDKTGKPWNPNKAVIAWDAEKKAWIGDVVDGGGDPGAKHPFIMLSTGLGAFFGPGLADGPFPEFYEPMECPVDKHPFSPVLHNPTALHFKDEKKAVCDPRFPFICSTYRVTEHWQTGVMTRNTPWLLEAEPQMFVEMSPALAEMRGIKNGEKVWVESVRGKLWAIAMVTPRIKDFKVGGTIVHQVGIPWHYGWSFPRNGGDSANLLTPSVGDPNTGIPETKAFMVNVTKAPEGGKA